MTKNTLLNNDLCNKVWLNPITHQTDSFSLKNMGLEMEMHAFDAKTFAPLGTEGSSLFPQDILKNIADNTKGAILVKDQPTGTIIGVKLAEGGNFSLEPGGQIEYSSKPTNNLTDLAQNVSDGLSLLEKGADNQAVFLSHGTNPISTAEHPLVVPKERYQFMTRYFKSAPSHVRGIHMMRYSATVQPNLDIFGCTNWHAGVKLILQLVPITNQLFANSAFFQGEKSAFLSERQNIWDNMDPTRSGYPTNLAVNEGCPQTECTYAKWAQKAYMLFISGLKAQDQPLYGEITFEQWIKNGYKGVFPKTEDWEIHLNSLFPHLRLRHFLEIRNIDAQPFEHSFAPMAFYNALLKNSRTQQKTWDILAEHKFNTFDIFAETQNFEKIFAPLLDFSCEVLENKKEEIGLNSLKAFKQFLNTRNDYSKEQNGFSFVKKQATFFPGKEFLKNLNL